MTCAGIPMLILCFFIGRSVWKMYLAIKHPDTYHEMQRTRRERGARAFDMGMGITKFFGKRKGW